MQGLEPAAREFAAAVGRSGPVSEFVQWVTDELRYRREPRKARLLMKAAEAIRASGVPPHVVDDRLLRVVLEEGALVDDDAMQDRWAQLLANGATATERPHVAFPGILAQLEPVEAQMLDAMHDALAYEMVKRRSAVGELLRNLNDALDDGGERSDVAQPADFNNGRAYWFGTHGFDTEFFEIRIRLDLQLYPNAAANLVRLRLADFTTRNGRQRIVHDATRASLSAGIQLTYFGECLVVACSPPGSWFAATRVTSYGHEVTQTTWPTGSVPPFDEYQ